jgi:diacylglycerol kinase (ATP)
LDRRKALVIYNPSAGNLRDADLCIGSIVHNLCKDDNYAVTVTTTIADMTQRQCVAMIADDYDLIVAAGGDGTIRLVLGAVSDTVPHTPVAIIPLGTGNQLARNLNIYEENLLSDPLLDGIEVMVSGTPTPIDLGLMNGEYFCVAAGAGPLSDAVITPSRNDKSNLKMLAYVSSMIQTFASPPVVFRVHTGEDNFDVSASGIFVTNVADLGVGILSDSAELSDGLLDLCIMNPTEFSDYLQLGFRFVGAFVSGEAPYYIRKVSSVDIDVIPVESRLSDLQAIAHKVRTTLKGQSEEPPRYEHVQAMIDGDAFGTTPMRIQVKPNAVRVLTKRK